GPDFAVAVLVAAPIGRVDLRAVDAPQPGRAILYIGPIFESLTLEAVARGRKVDAGERVAEAFAHRARLGAVRDRVGDGPAGHLVVLDGMTVLVDDGVPLLRLVGMAGPRDPHVQALVAGAVIGREACDGGVGVRLAIVGRGDAQALDVTLDRIDVI